MASKMEAMKAKAAAAGKAKEAAQAAAAYKKQDAKAKAAAPNFGAGKVFNTPKSASNPAKDRAAEANSPYNKAAQDKAKQAQQAKQADMASKVQSQRDSAAKAQQAKQSAMADRMKAAPKPAMPARPMGGGMGARPIGGTSGGMGGSAPVRPTSTARPAMTPQVKQGLQGMSDKLRALPMRTGMKKGGKAGKK